MVKTSHRADVSAQSEWALSARLRLLADAVRRRGGRLLGIERKRGGKGRDIHAWVEYELPELPPGDVADEGVRQTALARLAKLS